MIHNYHFIKYYFILGIWLIATGLACSQPNNKHKKEEIIMDTSFPYDIAPTHSYKMPKSLKEISGLTFLSKHLNTFYAVEDEDGLLYEYDLVQQKITNLTRFAEKGDYEEVITDENYFYILKSDGTIYSFPANNRINRQQVTINQGIVPAGEYESMAFDPSDASIKLLCKKCKADNKEQTILGYSLDIQKDGRLSLKSKFSIPLEKISAIDKRIKKNFSPSGISQHKGRKEWYILSSINQSLLITDQAFQPKKVIRLPRKHFEQPEGIAFDANENLFISSEAGDQEHGMVYQFKLIK